MKLEQIRRVQVYYLHIMVKESKDICKAYKMAMWLATPII